MFKNEYIICPNCGKQIFHPCFKKHYEAYIDPNSKMNNKSPKYNLDHSDLFCKYCGKECKNKVSLVNHESRCSKNPNRKYNPLYDYSIKYKKGRNKTNCSLIAKQASTLNEKYSQGYISPLLGTKNTFEYVYKDHNNQEISKWIKYLKSLDIPSLEPYKITKGPEGYNLITGFKDLFEHEYKLQFMFPNIKQYTIHHINKIRNDNDLFNLMVFETSKEHKRFHNSKYSYLSYNENTHLFNCVLIYDENYKG